tara:strand:+ start:112 stop:888 length:777 start_codon:yes stop_codon:yes gene_type:complete
MPTEENFNKLKFYKRLSDETTNPGAYASANAKGAILYIQSTITGYMENFPAFLTDFSQTFQSNWNTEEVYGRNDPIATFQGTKRTISLGFDLPAGSAKDAENNLNKCSNLIQMMYPGYHQTTKKKVTKTDHSGGHVPDTVIGPNNPGPVSVTSQNETTEYINTGNVIGKSPLVKITFSNLIKANEGDGGLLGWIGSLSWKPNLEMGMFIGAFGAFYPKVISLSFDFNVLHQTELGQKNPKTTSITAGWLGPNKKFPFK